MADPSYIGSAYITISLTHEKIRAIAHEAGYVSGVFFNTAADMDIMDGRTATNVSGSLCNSMRAIT